MEPDIKRALKPVHGINLLCNLRSRTKQIYKHNSRIKHSIINTVILVNIIIYINAVESLFYYIKANVDWIFLHHLHLMSLRLRIRSDYERVFVQHSHTLPKSLRNNNNNNKDFYFREYSLDDVSLSATRPSTSNLR